MGRGYKAIFMCIVISLFLTSCNIPGITKIEDSDDDFFVYNSHVDESEEQLHDDYSWIKKPSIQAANIITPDLSQINTNENVNRAYLNGSIIFNNGKYGFINYEGSVILEPSYDNYYICSCGEMILYNKKDNIISESCSLNIYGEINYNVRWHDDYYSEYYWDDSKGKVFEKKNNELYAKESTNKNLLVAMDTEVIPIDYNKYSVPSSSNQLFALIKDNKLVSNFEYEDYYMPAYRKIKSTAVALKKNGKWGYVSEDGDEIIPFECSDVLSAFNGNLSNEKTHPYLFSYGYVPVCIDSKYYYYDMEGNKVSSINNFEQARPVINGRAWVKESGKWGIIQLGEIKDYSKFSSKTTTTQRTYQKYKHTTKKDSSKTSTTTNKTSTKSDTKTKKSSKKQITTKVITTSTVKQEKTNQVKSKTKATTLKTENVHKTT